MTARNRPPLTWTTWFMWIVVCAAVPVFNAALDAALQKNILRTDPNADQIRAVMWGIIIGSIFLPRIMEWFVLRRLAPRLPLYAWLMALLAAGITWLAIFLALGLHRREPWHGLLLTSLIMTVAIYAVPLLLLAWLSGHRFSVLLAAAFAGVVAAAACDSMFDLFANANRVGRNRGLNGVSWYGRINELSYRTATGAVWGAASGLAFAAFSSTGAGAVTDQPRWLPKPTERRGLVGMAWMTALLACAAPLAHYINSDNGLRAGFPALRRMISIAPWSDRSTGEPILTLSHQAAIEWGPYSRVLVSPDGAGLVIETSSRLLAHIHVATGRRLGAFGEPSQPGERREYLWSPDSRYFILRSSKAEYPGGNTAFQLRRTRLRVFAQSGDPAIAEWQDSDGKCLDSHAASLTMSFAADGRSLWVLCSQMRQPGSGDLVAIRLSLPELAQLEEARYGDTANLGSARGLVTISGRIATWHLRHPTFRILDLASGAVLQELTGLDAPELGGAMTFQAGQSRVADDAIMLRYCGFPTAHIPKDDRSALIAATNRCRDLSFDVTSGKLLFTQEMERGWSVTQREIATGGRRLLISTRYTLSSKTGLLLIIDAETRREVQRIETAAQDIVAISANMGWLISREAYRGVLRFYRIGAAR